MSANTLAVVVLAVLVSSLPAPGAEGTRGLWLTPRKDPSNQARADVPGRMSEAPQEVWRVGTGGQIRFARNVRVQDEDVLLVQAGSTLQLLRRTGEPIWRNFTLGVGLVVRVDDFDGDDAPEALVRTDVRTVVLLDVATGRRLWSWLSL